MLCARIIAVNQVDEDLGAVFIRLRDSLRSYLRRRVPDPSVADDLIQEIFLKALSSDRSGRRIGNITGWLYTAARNTVADYYRASPGRMELLDDSTPAVAEDEDLRLHQELSVCLRGFVDRLPPIYRDTLIAADLGGETLRSLARREAVSESAIKSRAVRARAMLRERLLACCHVETAGGLVTDYHCVDQSGCSGGSCA